MDSSISSTPVRDALRDAGYTQDAMVEIIRPLGPNQRIDGPMVARKAKDDTPFHLCVRLLALGLPVPEKRMREVLTPRVADQLLGVGLLIPDGDSVRSIAKLMPFNEWYVIGDYGSEVTGKAPRPDHVLGVGAASISLSNYTVRRPCGSVLDLGTGAGIQALLASRHARSVVGTDTNPRALNFGAFNAWLNGMKNVTFRQGSFFDPVKGEKFDLVVSNPPYVISPESKYIYRDSGLRGDEVCERVVGGAAQHLADGGYAVILTNWHHAGDEDWDETPRRWAAGTGCDAWILCFDTELPLTYAAKWLRTSGECDDAAFAGSLDEWLAYYESLKIGRISAGVVVLRRATGRPAWVRADRIDVGPHSGVCGSQIQRIFDSETFLQTVKDDGVLLNSVFATCSDHVLEHGLALEGGEWAMRSSRLRLAHGLAFSGDVDLYVTAMLARCDGKRPLQPIMREVLGEENAGQAETRVAVIEMVKKLLRSGLLLPGPNGAGLSEQGTGGCG